MFRNLDSNSGLPVSAQLGKNLEGVVVSRAVSILTCKKPKSAKSTQYLLFSWRARYTSRTEARSPAGTGFGASN